ncbi:MAG TPA: acyl-CoA dehydrogenase family protein [Acidimicrobiales bacterium]|nr:acyl-CoA dehydrogenase family protein [Acidimicrobiales bacterium]
MAWDFSTEPEFQAQLDWMDAFVTEEIEPLDLLWGSLTYHPLDDDLRAIVEPLKDAVRQRRLWACHLGPELGGQGYGQVKLALMNEVLGRSQWAPIIFGTQAPDTGNAEIIAHYGTDEQKRKYLQPLLDGEIFSCYSMTEPQGGSDPALFETQAVRDGDDWVINGHKFFSSNARTASFLIVMAITDPEADVYRGMSMFLVPAGTPGLKIVRNIGLSSEPVPGGGMHALIHYDNVRVPAGNLLGGEGQAFAVAQTRLGGGRVHHAMRTVGMARRALDMLCERAVSRKTRTGVLGDLPSVRDYVADSYIELTQFRLLVMYVAWCIDEGADARAVRRDIAAIKVLTPQVLHNVTQRAIQVHGALGVSDEMPLGSLWTTAPILGLVDGPTELHRNTVARQVLRNYRPVDGPWPSQHVPTRTAGARAKFKDHAGALLSAVPPPAEVASELEIEVGNL